MIGRRQAAGLTNALLLNPLACVKYQLWGHACQCPSALTPPLPLHCLHPHLIPAARLWPLTSAARKAGLAVTCAAAARLLTTTSLLPLADSQRTILKHAWSMLKHAGPAAFYRGCAHNGSSRLPSGRGAHQVVLTQRTVSASSLICP